MPLPNGPYLENEDGEWEEIDENEEEGSSEIDDTYSENGETDENVDESPDAPLHDEVNKRAGHIAVQYGEGALVWGGYSEVPSYLDGHEYYLPSEVWHYSYLKNTWKKLRTTGDIPNRCSGAGACVIQDFLYIVAGYHQVLNNNIDGYPDDESDEEMENEPRVQISNRLWRLNLQTLAWQKLKPDGVPPLYCDKTSLWAYYKKAYMFGGFGPPPRIDLHTEVADQFTFCHDEDNPGAAYGLAYARGWNNQLLYYDEDLNKWIWPRTNGEPPSPRACHSVAIIQDKAYIFGGRHNEIRLNDLYSLDMRSHTWQQIFLPHDSPPAGRSWQSLTPLYTGKEAGALLLYGGFDNESNALGDCWKIDLSKDDKEWTHMKHLEQGTRLWHSAVAVNTSTVIIAGGVTDNILSPHHIEKHHADKVLFLEVNPKRLLSSVLEYITVNHKMYSSQIEELPQHLRIILEARLEVEKSNRNQGG